MNTGSIRRVRSSLIFGIDLLSIVACFSLFYLVRIGRFPDFLSIDLWLIVSTFLLVLFLSGTYFRERSTSFPKLPVRTFWTCFLAGLICVGWVYILGPLEFNEYFGRGVLPAGTIASGIVTTLNRYLINRIYHLQERGAELLYLGYSSNTTSFLAELSNHSEVRSVTIAAKEADFPISKRVNRTAQTLLDLKLTNPWRTVIIDPDFVANSKETTALVELRLSGIPIISLADYYEQYWYMIPVASIDDDWFLRSHGFSVLDNAVSRRVKRVLDVLCSIAVLLLSAPLLMICSAAIKSTSVGPIFYRQTRVGLQGKPFTIIKLRTMRTDAEQDGAQWAQKNDPRITLVGRFLRASRLDEIPQCWNVLKGEMSFVGPRPERPEFTKELSEQIPYYDLRHLVKPGITGWAQVIFPYGASVEDALKKLQYELFYIKNQSFLLDLNILLRTLITVFQRAGR